MTLLIFLLSMISVAEGVPNETSDTEVVDEVITVEAHKGYDVYVALPTYHIHDDSYTVTIPYHMIYNYASMHSRQAKALARYKTWHSVETLGGVRIYNKDTIEYVWDNCRYDRDHRKCSHKNSHYFVETNVTISKNEVNISMTLFNPNMQALNTSSISDKAITRWIKQQEITIIQKQSMMSSTTITHKPKEEMPLEWTIPPRLFSDAIRQASIRLWTGVKLD